MKIYGILEKDDVIKDGDEFFDPDVEKWFPCRFEHYGLKFKPGKYRETRRALNTDELAVKENEQLKPKMPEFLKFYDEARCIVGEELNQGEYVLVKRLYDFITRQLRAA